MKRTAIAKKQSAAGSDEILSSEPAARLFEPAAAPPLLSAKGRGTLHLVAVPIGNPDDISARALRTLQEADLVIVEDARIAQKFFAAHEIASKRVVSLRPRHAQAALEALQTALNAGQKVALIADAGTPGIADPGQGLIRAALDCGSVVTAVPGPCAALVALTASGLPAGRFAFDGFPPRARADRAAFFHELAGEPRTLILYESARYLTATLFELCRVCSPSRPAALACDLTKSSENIQRGSLAELLAFFRQKPPDGEYTLVVAGKPKTSALEVL